MTNEEIWREMKRLSKKIDEYYKRGDLAKRNELAERWRELYQKYDFGYRVGDKVRCPIAQKNKIFEITKITGENRFILDDAVIVCGTLLEPYEPEPEQLSLFD